VENDPGFARFLLDAAREKGFKGLVTARGAVALTLAREYNPDAVTLDIHLPDIDGWRVLERLKKDPALRHIPVCVVSTDDAKNQALSSGCLAFLGKPIRSRDVLDGLLDHLSDFLGRPAPHLLLVEPDQERREQLRRHLADPGVLLTATADTAAALKVITERPTECVVLGPGAADMSEELLASAGLDGPGLDGDAPAGVATRLPVILYGHGAAETARADSWRRAADACTVRAAGDPAELVAQATYFLHRPITKLPDVQRQKLVEMHQAGDILGGRKVLIVDDDVRNIFALSTILEEHDMVILSADNGRDAIRTLKEDPGVEIVLMDIMMPEMDGMETMREIRKIPHLKNLPIVAVTAKAMKGDREKCIEAGAWDYLSKPVDPEQLLSVLRSWLHR
jgi:CheY-like chemotaxis protein